MQSNRAKAKWSLLQTDKHLKDRLFAEMGVANADSACNNLEQLLSAVSKIVKETFHQLPQETKNTVYNHVYHLANIQTTDLRWGENHACDDIKRLTTALYAAEVFRDAITCQSFENNRDLIPSLAAINNDIDIFKTLVSYSGGLLEFASPELQNNPEIVLTAIIQDSGAFRFASAALKKNPEFILDILKHSSSQDIFMYVDESIKSNKEIALKAVARNGLILYHLSPELKNDLEIVKIAVTTTPIAYIYASDRIKKNLEVAKIFVASSNSLFHELHPAIQINRDVVKIAVSQTPNVFKSVSLIFRDDDEIAFLAASRNGALLRFASDRLKKNIDFLSKVFQSNSRVFIQSSNLLSKDLRLTVCIPKIKDKLKQIETEFPDLASKLMKDLSEYKDADVQTYMLSTISHMEPNDIYNSFASQKFTLKQKEDVLMILLMINSIKHPEKLHIEDLLKRHYRSIFKDNLKRQPFLRLLQQIDILISNENKYRLLSSILERQEKTPLFNCIFLLNTVIAVNKWNFLTEENLNLKDLSILLVSDLQDNGIVPAGKDNAERIMAVFSRFRMPGAFFTYASSFLEDTEMQKALYRFTESLIHETFIHNRHEANSHKSFLTPNQKTQWETALTPQTVTADDDTVSFNIKDFLQKKLVRDQHGGLFLKRIALYLQDGTAIDNPNTLEQKVIELLNPQENLLLKIRDLKLFLEQSEYDTLEFKNDLIAAIDQLENSSAATGTLVDSESPEDLFLCGTEVAGSCQRIDGLPASNKGLMGYVLDGKIRLIAVKNAQGTILARSIVKLLVTKEGKPCLFFEPVYGDVKFTKALVSFAKAKAESMHVELFQVSSTSHFKTLYSYGNCAPHEYEDGTYNITNGEYTIDAKLLN